MKRVLMKPLLSKWAVNRTVKQRDLKGKTRFTYLILANTKQGTLVDLSKYDRGVILELRLKRLIATARTKDTNIECLLVGSSVFAIEGFLDNKRVSYV